MENWNDGWFGRLTNPPMKELTIDPEFILWGMGMKRSDADEYLLSLIDTLIAECLPLAQPSTGYTIRNNISIDGKKHQIAVGETTFDSGKVVTNSLKKSSRLVLFSATIGEKIETLSKELMQSNHALEGLIVDLIGSELVEAIVEKFHNHISEMALHEGLIASNRYSPGYCNWPVSDQHKLFPLLHSYNCGITLTESSLMLPIKSVTGIIGLGKDLKRSDYKCKACPDLKCIMRKA